MSRIGDDDKQRFTAFAMTAAQDQIAVGMAINRVYRALLQNDSAELADAINFIARHSANLTSRAITFKALAASINK